MSVFLMALMPALLAEAQTVGAAAKENENQSLSRRITVAVLPFENKTSDKQASHWRYSIQRMLDEQLRIVKAVRLRPRDSTGYAFKQLDLSEDASVNADQAKRIGEIIEAQRVVWGSYRKENNKWTVQVRVLNVASGKVSGELMVKSGDLFEVSDKLIEKILHELDVAPSQTERQELGQRYTTSYDALEYYSKAVELQEDDQPLIEQEDLLHKAVAADPCFAEAYTGLAAVLFSQGKLKEAEESVRQLLKIDPNDAQSHAFLGTLFIFQENDREAELELKKAYSLDADDSESLIRLGEMYLVQDRLDDAIAITEKARLIDFANPDIYAQLGFLYAKNRERDKAMTALKEAERLSSDNVNAEQFICQAYQILGEIPSAVEHYEKFLLQARQLGANPKLVASFEKIAQELRETLKPTYVKLSMPKVYTEQDLQKVLRVKLSESELRNVVNPIASNPEMKRFAQQITKDANSDLGKAKAIFDALIRRISTEGKVGARTAKEVFNAWKDPNESFSCQEYAKLYIALARDADVNVFYVHVDKMYSGRIVHHDCAAVFLNNNEALLVDPAQYWFGVPHKDFEVLDDLKALAHHLYQSGDLSQCQLAAKLQPDSAFGRFMLGQLFRSANRIDEARKELKAALDLDPNRWEVKLLQGILEGDDDNFEAAANYIRKALALNPESAEGHYFLGLTLIIQGKFMEAQEEYRACLRYEPTDEMAKEAQRMIVEINELNPNYSMGAKKELAASVKEPKQGAVITQTFDANGQPIDHGISLAALMLKEIEALKQAIKIDPNDAEAYCNLGFAYSSLGHKEEAIEAYKQAIKIKPDDAMAHYNLGVAYSNLGRYQEALVAFQRAIKIRPDYADAHSNLGVAYNNLGNHQDAVESLKQAIKIKPDDAISYSNLGAAYDNLGRQQDAIEFLKQAIRINPDYDEAYYNLGTAYVNLGRHQEAIDAYKQAIKINPDLVEAYSNLGLVYIKLGRYTEAMEAYKQAVKLKPDYAKVHSGLGAAFAKLGRYTEAIESLKRAITIKPDFPEAHSNLGYVYLQLGRYMDVIEACNKAIKIDPNYADAHCNLGAAYGLLGRNKEAVESLKQAITIKPDNALAHYNLGAVYVNLCQYQEALEAYKQAIKLKPDYAEACYDLGTLYLQLGRHAEAIEILKQTIRIKPDFAAAHSNLGTAYLQIGRYKEAIEANNQALKIKPDFAEAHNNLGNAYLNLDRYQEAIEAYKQTIKIKPDYAEAFYNLGFAYGRIGHNKEAVEALNQAVKIKPGLDQAHYWLGVNYLAIQNKDKAIEEYKILEMLKSSFAEELRSLINK